MMPAPGVRWPGCPAGLPGLGSWYITSENLRIRMADGKEFLLPDIPYFVLHVDTENRIIRIHMDEGLL